MTSRKTAADILLEAQVHFIVGQLGGPALQDLIERELDAALAAAGKLTLNACVERRAVKDTARTYAAEVEFGAGIPELVGEVARALHAHEIHDRTTLADLVSDRRLRQTLDQLLEMRSMRTRLLHQAADSPLYSAFVSDLLYHGIKGYLAENPITRNIPGASSMMKLGKTVLSKATPRLEGAIEESLKKYISRSVQTTAQRSLSFFLEHADDELLRDAALDFWKQLKRLPIGSWRADLGEREVEELFVSGYEFWRELRRSEYYNALIEAGIDVVFDRYGEVPLATLLEDFGITRELMLAEGMRYAPRALAALRKHKLLEKLVRRNLEPFYRSPEFREALTSAANAAHT